MKKRTLYSLLIMALLYCMPLISNAQPGGPEDDPDVPIDGGLSLLVAAGVGYAVKKGYAKRKKVETRQTDK
jgi:hypothetical protein